VGEPLRIAVAGLGSMGANHVRVLSDLPDVELVGVMDVDPSRVQRVTARRPFPGFDDLRRMLEETRPQALVVAVPTRAHAEVAREALRRGVHVLVEKPIAASVPEARELEREAAQRGLVLSVGHVERFNPAVAELRRRLAAGEGGRVFQLHARRIGPFPQRIRDVGVVLDLATHDVDVCRFLLGEDVERVYAAVQRRIHTENEDLCVGMLHFRSGTVALIETNWLTPVKERSLRVLCERGMYVVDYLAQTLTFYENHAAVARDGSPVSVTEGPMVRYPIPFKEPLRAELEAFRDAVRIGDPAPVPASDAIAALEITEALVASASSGEPKTLATVSAG